MRPITSSPLRTGDITITGHQWIDGVSASNNFFGTLTMVASSSVPDLSNSTVTVSPSSTMVGTNATITITLKDASNNAVSGFSAGNISISATGTNNTITKLASSTNASGVLQATITSTKAEAKTISVMLFGVGDLTQTASATFTPAAPAKAVITAATTTAVAGTPIPLSISLTDPYDNVVADGSSATLLSSLGSVTGTSTTVSGVMARSVYSTTTGIATLSFSDLIAPGEVTGDTSLIFTPGPATTITITVQPSSTASVDSAFTTQPVMNVTDQYGNAVADGTVVTATPVAPAAGVLRNISVTTASGVAQYGLLGSTELGYSKSDETFQIMFSADSATAVSDPLGPLAHGAIVKTVPVADPSSLFAGASTTVTISGRDQFDNITTSNSTTNGVIIFNGGSLSPDNLFALTGGLDTRTLTKSTPGVVHLTTRATGLLDGETDVTFTQSDTTGPTLVSVFPAQNATDVSVSTSLFLDFSETLKASTVNSDNIQLVNASTSATVPATVSLDEGGTRVHITPSSPLDFETHYYFQASSAVTDEAGNALTSDVSSETTGFTTGVNTADVTAPTVVSATPSDESGVAVTVVPFIDFSESMKASTLTTDSVQLRRVSDDSVVASVLTLANGGTRAVLTPNSSLDYSTNYYLFVDSTVTDEAGNPLGGEGFTADSFQTVEQPGDERAPIVSNIQVTSITTSSAIITWNTDEAASSQVEFGLTSGYGSITDLDNSLVTEHSVLVSGLGANSTYHFRVRSADEAENEAISDDNTFSTLIDDSATLIVTQITSVRSFATADDTFASGWKWIFDVTVPTDETEVFMKFSDFAGTPAGSIPAADNVRFYSEQSSNAADASSSIVISAADTYAGTLMLDADRNSTTPGRQIQIMVEVKAPVGTPGGSYSASYGLKSQQPEQVEEQPL